MSYGTSGQQALPTLKRNAVLIRIESATLVKENCKFFPKSTLELERKNKRIDIYVQPTDEIHQIELTSPSKKHSFDSIGGTATEPLWTTVYNDDYTNGDIWVPMEEDHGDITIKIRNNNFIGKMTIDLSKDTKSESRDYELFDEHGKKLEGSSLRLGYEFGTQYEVEFRTGDPHFTPGTGTDSEFLNNISQTAGILFANLYRKLKRFNPFGIGQNDTDRSSKSDVMVQVNGLNASSRFYLCKDGTTGDIKIPETHHVSTYSRYKIFVPLSVGVPLSLSVRLVPYTDSKLTWFLEKVLLKTIGDETNELVMPCYQWITGGKVKSISLPYGFLPQTITDVPQFERLRLERLNELEVAKSKYQWEVENVVPSYLRGTKFGSYDLVPLNEKFDDFKTKDFSYLTAKGLQNTAINNAIQKLHKINHVEDYYNLYHLGLSNAIMKPTVTIENWTDDAYFGWNSLTGINPLHIELCKTVPAQFLNEKDVIRDLSGNPLDLEDESKNGRIFISDYSGLAKYNLHTEGQKSAPVLQIGRKYSSPCVCLYHVSSDQKLRPIAIQLTPEGPIFTPKDTKWQWMFAKISVRNADAQYHQLSYHWLYAHALGEAFSISLNRSLSRVHPLFRLLVPHLKYTVSINTLARRSLINPGGFICQLASIGDKMGDFLEEAYSQLDFSKLDLPSRLESRGLTRDNKGALIDFPFMDDGLLIWDAMSTFIGHYLALYYTCDDDVVNDSEVANWITELQVNGLPNRQIPDVKTIADLQKFVTIIMWTCSAYHSAVNFNQYNTYGFVPNCPFALFRAPPTSKDQVNEKFIIDALPKATHASLSIMLSNVLATYAENEEYLTSPRYIELIGEPKAKECVKDYRTRLHEIDAIIKKRNEERVKRGFFEYKVLMPSHIPNSVAI